MAKKDAEIVIKYIFSKDYNPKYVNGAYGGISPRGEITVNFFMERTALPTSQTFLLKDGEQQKELIERREPKNHESSFVRYVQNGIVLDLKNAKEIHRWLGTHIQNLENLIAKNNA